MTVDSRPSHVDVVAELRGVTLGQVRAAISPSCYERSVGRAIAALAFDAALYAAAVAGVFFGPRPLAPAFGVVAGCAVAFLFVWGHDAAHGALFASRRWSELLGTLAMLPSLHMYRLWAFGHNKVHHGFTSLSTIDWIWRPMTPAEYAAASARRRLLYRLERHPATCALHYLLRVWWPGMVTFRPAAGRRTRGFRASQAGVLVFVLGFGTIAYRYGGGPVGVLNAVVLPFVVFTYFIALFVYLHHTHPEVPFFTNRQEWSATLGQVACSTVVRCGRMAEWLTHDILVHMPHHVDTKIPFFNLRRAYEDLRPAYGHIVVEYRFAWSTVREIFRQCQLFDFDARTWHRFDEQEARRVRTEREGPRSLPVRP